MKTQILKIINTFTWIFLCGLGLAGIMFNIDAPRKFKHTVHSTYVDIPLDSSTTAKVFYEYHENPNTDVVIVCGPSMYGTTLCFDYLINDLIKYGSVLVVDLPGRGNADSLPVEYYIPDNDVKIYRNILSKLHNKQLVCVGNCVGFITLCMAAKDMNNVLGFISLDYYTYVHRYACPYFIRKPFILSGIFDCSWLITVLGECLLSKYPFSQVVKYANFSCDYKFLKKVSSLRFGDEGGFKDFIKVYETDKQGKIFALYNHSKQVKDIRQPVCLLYGQDSYFLNRHINNVKIMEDHFANAKSFIAHEIKNAHHPLVVNNKDDRNILTSIIKNWIYDYKSTSALTNKT